MYKIGNWKLKIGNSRKGFTLIELLIVIGIIGFFGIGFYTNFFGSKFNFDCSVCLLKTLSPIIFLLLSVFFGFTLSSGRKDGIKLLGFFVAIFSIALIGGITRNYVKTHTDFQGTDGIIKLITIVLIFGIIYYFFKHRNVTKE